VRLGDHVDLLSGFPFKSKGFTSNPEDIPLVKGANVHQGFIDWDTAQRWPANELEEHAKFLLEPDDVVLAMDRPWIEAGLKWAWIRHEHPASLLVQRVSRLRGVNGLETRFLRYVIGSPSFSDYIRPIVTGVNVPHISGGQIKDYRFQLPPPAAQQKIASVLSSYDDLIENNTRRIAILEEMAQSLYREWFVEYRFPGHDKARFVDSPFGKIPEGWRAQRLEDWASEERRSVDPSEVDPDTPYFGLEHLPRRSITLSEWGRATDVQSTKLQFRKGEILFGKIRPYFHKVGVAPVDGVCSTDAIVIVPASARGFAPVLCCASSDDFISHATQTSQGTKMPRANWDVLLKYPLPCPPEPLLTDFNASINDLVASLRVLMMKNRNLRHARDLLLPKLMSGQLDVENLDIDTGETLAGVEA
jgi:type I restriction enzyme S subunit